MPTMPFCIDCNDTIYVRIRNNSVLINILKERRSSNILVTLLAFFITKSCYKRPTVIVFQNRRKRNIIQKFNQNVLSQSIRESTMTGITNYLKRIQCILITTTSIIKGLSIPIRIFSFTSKFYFPFSSFVCAHFASSSLIDDFFTTACLS